MYSGEPLTIAEYDLKALIARAQAGRSIIVLNYAVGDVVLDGSVLLTVRGGSVVSSQTLRSAIVLAPARTFADDPEFALRIFVDIAIRALSPAVNDPTTAVQALDQITDYLVHVGNAPIPTGYVGDDTGTLCVVYPAPSWSDFLELAFNEICFYGSSSIQIQRRVRAALDDLAHIVTDPARAEAARTYQRRLDEEPTTFDETDRALAQKPDRHGLGSATG